MAKYNLYIYFDITEHEEIREVEEGELVTLKAPDGNEEYSFAKWVAEGVSLEDPHSQEISFIMPANEAGVAARYYTVFIYISEYGQYYQYQRAGGTQFVHVMHQDPPEGQHFDRWYTEAVELKNPRDTVLRFTVPNPEDGSLWIHIYAQYETNEHTIFFDDGTWWEKAKTGERKQYSTTYELEDGCRLSDWPVTGVDDRQKQLYSGNLYFTMPDNDVHVGLPIWENCPCTIAYLNKAIYYGSENLWKGPYAVTTHIGTVSKHIVYDTSSISPLASDWHNWNFEPSGIACSERMPEVVYAASKISDDSADESGLVADGNGRVLMSDNKVMVTNAYKVMFDSTCPERSGGGDLNQWCATLVNTVFVEPPYMAYAVPWIDITGFKAPYHDTECLRRKATPFTSATIKLWDCWNWSRDNSCDLIAHGGYGVRYMVSYIGNIEKGVLESSIYLDGGYRSNAISSWVISNEDTAPYVYAYAAEAYIDCGLEAKPQLINPDYLPYIGIYPRNSRTAYAPQSAGNIIDQLYKISSGYELGGYVHSGCIYRLNMSNTSYCSYGAKYLDSDASYNETTFYIVGFSDGIESPVHGDMAGIYRRKEYSDPEKMILRVVYYTNGKGYLFTGRLALDDETVLYNMLILSDKGFIKEEYAWPASDAIGWAENTEGAVTFTLLPERELVCEKNSMTDLSPLAAKAGTDTSLTRMPIGFNRMFAIHPQGGWEDTSVVAGNNHVRSITKYVYDESGEFVPGSVITYYGHRPMRSRYGTELAGKSHALGVLEGMPEWCSFGDALWGSFTVSAECTGPYYKNVSCVFMRAGELADIYDKNEIPVYSSNLQLLDDEDETKRRRIGSSTFDGYPGWVYRAHVLTDMPIDYANQKFSQWAIDGAAMDAPRSCALYASLIFKNTICRSAFMLFRRGWSKNCGVDAYGYGRVFPYERDESIDTVVTHIEQNEHGNADDPWEQGPGLEVVLRKLPGFVSCSDRTWQAWHEQDEEAQYGYPGTREYYSSDHHYYMPIMVRASLFSDWVSVNKCTIPVSPDELDSEYKDILRYDGSIISDLKSSHAYPGAGIADRFWPHISLVRREPIQPPECMPITGTYATVYSYKMIPADAPGMWPGLWAESVGVYTSNSYYSCEWPKIYPYYEREDGKRLGYLDTYVATVPPGYNAQMAVAVTCASYGKILLDDGRQLECEPGGGVYTTYMRNDGTYGYGGAVAAEDGIAHGYAKLGKYIKKPAGGWKAYTGTSALAGSVISAELVEYAYPRAECTSEGDNWYARYIKHHDAIAYLCNWSSALKDYIFYTNLESEPGTFIVEQMISMNSNHEYDCSLTVFGAHVSSYVGYGNINIRCGALCTIIDGECIDSKIRFGTADIYNIDSRRGTGKWISEWTKCEYDSYLYKPFGTTAYFLGGFDPTHTSGFVPARMDGLTRVDSRMFVEDIPVTDPTSCLVQAKGVKHSYDGEEVPYTYQFYNIPSRYDCNRAFVPGFDKKCTKLVQHGILHNREKLSIACPEMFAWASANGGYPEVLSTNYRHDQYMPYVLGSVEKLNATELRVGYSLGYGYATSDFFSSEYDVEGRTCDRIKTSHNSNYYILYTMSACYTQRWKIKED